MIFISNIALIAGTCFPIISLFTFFLENSGLVKVVDDKLQIRQLWGNISEELQMSILNKAGGLLKLMIFNANQTGMYLPPRSNNHILRNSILKKRKISLNSPFVGRMEGADKLNKSKY